MITVIETEHLLLQTWLPEDALKLPALHQEDGLPDLYIEGPFKGTSPRELISMWNAEHEEKGYSNWAVREKESGELIGHAGLIEPESKGKIFLDVLLGPKHWGNKYGEELVQNIIHYAFEELDIEKISAIAKPANVRFTRILEDLKFAHRKETIYFGTYVSYYELKEEDLKWELFKYLK